VFTHSICDFSPPNSHMSVVPLGALASGEKGLLGEWASVRGRTMVVASSQDVVERRPSQAYALYVNIPSYYIALRASYGPRSFVDASKGLIRSFLHV
jgi:hypothetical protein